MNHINTILEIPERCLVNKKISKAFFKRNFELTNSEKMLLDDFNTVSAIDWIASIKPSTSNISRYQDDHNLFEEVQIIGVQTAGTDFERNHFKIAELVQKYIPYPVLLYIYGTKGFVLTTGDKKINQNDSTKRTLDKKYSTEIINRNDPTQQQQAFLDSLAFGKLDKTNLKTYYDGYTQRVIALQAAKINGSFTPRSQGRTQTDMDTLEKMEVLQKEIQLLQNQAKKESQLSQQIVLNTEVQLKRKQIEHLKALITA